MTENSTPNNLIEYLEDKFKGIESKFEGIEEKVDTLNNNINLLKGSSALLETLLEAPNIAKDLGLQYESTFTSNEIQNLTEEIATKTSTEIVGQLDSLRHIDLIVRASWSEENVSAIIPIAASWTLSKKDVMSVSSHVASLVEHTEVDFVLPAVSARKITDTTLKYAQQEDVHVNQLRKVF